VFFFFFFACYVTHTRTRPVEGNNLIGSRLPWPLGRVNVAPAFAFRLSPFAFSFSFSFSFSLLLPYEIPVSYRSLQILAPFVLIEYSTLDKSFTFQISQLLILTRHA